MYMEEQILKMMKTLDITREEAIDLINEDREIDRKKDSQVDDDLSAEQKKAKKKYTNVKRGVNAYGKKTERVIKPDENKRLIILLKRIQNIKLLIQFHSQMMRGMHLQLIKNKMI